jgi:hypothetical protein
LLGLVAGALVMRGLLALDAGALQLLGALALFVGDRARRRRRLAALQAPAAGAARLAGARLPMIVAFGRRIGSPRDLARPPVDGAIAVGAGIMALVMQNADVVVITRPHAVLAGGIVLIVVAFVLALSTLMILALMAWLCMGIMLRLAGRMLRRLTGL